MAAMSAIAQGSARAPERPTMVSTMVSLPPDLASMAPTMAPSAMSSPTDPAVEPKPVVKLVTRSIGPAHATRPSAAAPSIKETKGCTLPHTIRATTVAMPARAARTSWVLPAWLISGGSAARGRSGGVTRVSFRDVDAQLREHAVDDLGGGAVDGHDEPGLVGTERLEGVELAVQQ